MTNTWRFVTLEGERANLVSDTQSPRTTTLLDDLEFEWLLVRSSAFLDWQRQLMAVLGIKAASTKINDNLGGARQGV